MHRIYHRLEAKSADILYRQNRCSVPLSAAIMCGTDEILHHSESLSGVFALTLCAGEPLRAAALVLARPPWMGEVVLLPPRLLLPEAVLVPDRTAAVLIPSSSRTNKMLVGRSSTLCSTKLRHSGHRSSLLVLTISSKHRRQNVC